jgi:hypothetical protein
MRKAMIWGSSLESASTPGDNWAYSVVGVNSCGQTGLLLLARQRSSGQGVPYRGQNPGQP